MADRNSGSRDFVLVHGAWHGGWCYERVRDVLGTHGHRVFTPTLPGLCEQRSSIGEEVINCTTHIRDIVSLIERERLSRVVLCGHSYGGQVAAGVADAIPDRIDSLVYLDAAIPVDGMCVLDVLGHGDDGVAGAVRGISGSWLPALPGSTWNLINPADEAMVDALCTPQPLATFTERLSLTGAYMTIPKKTYILATAWNGQPDPSKYEWTRYDDSWTFREIACGHDVMLDAPEQLAEMLIEAM